MKGAKCKKCRKGKHLECGYVDGKGYNKGCNCNCNKADKQYNYFENE